MVNGQFATFVNDEPLAIDDSRSHSVRNDFAGFVDAALMACELTVMNAISNAMAAAAMNTHQ